MTLGQMVRQASLIACRSGALTGDVLLLLFALWVMLTGWPHPAVLACAALIAAFAVVNALVVLASWGGMSRPMLGHWWLLAYGLGLALPVLVVAAGLGGEGTDPTRLLGVLVVPVLNVWAVEGSLLQRAGRGPYKAPNSGA